MKRSVITILVFVLAVSLTVLARQQGREKLDKIEQDLKSDVPHLLCIDERISTGGQPKEEAFAKLAANGFRSVLSLRQPTEGPEVAREQEVIEKAGLRFINIPIVTSAPKAEDVEAFIKAVKDQSNQPMLIHCGSANRVGAFWMIYRVVEQGWPEDKAMEEAIKIGLTNPGLKSFAQNYIAAWKQKKS
jgi:uncharacterized protein (TIGR01244 family)